MDMVAMFNVPGLVPGFLDHRCGDYVLFAIGRRLTPRWSGRVIDKVPSSNFGVRAAQLNR